MQIQHVAGPIWKAESSGSKWYDIDLDVPSCNCVNFAIQRNKLKAAGKYAESEAYRCKHLKAVLNKTGQVVGNLPLDAAEKAKVAARKAAIVSKFTEREPSRQEMALREALKR